MTILQSLVSFTAVAVLLTIIPGLDTALVLRSAVSGGRSRAFATALGICSGALVWGVAAAVGASALLAASTVAFMVLKLVGAAYMIYLGANLLRKSFSGSGPVRPAGDNGRAGGWGRAWLTGAGTNLLNPKVGVFYIAMIPQFIPAGAPPLAMGLALAGIHIVLSLAWFGMLILGTGLFGRYLASPKAVTYTDRGTGVVLIGFGTLLALER